MRRYSESVTDRGVSLWEAVLRFVRDHGFVTRADVLRRFHADDEATVRAVLKDLVDTGLLFRAGPADRTTFRAAKPEEVAAVDDGTDTAAQFVRVLLHQQGPLAPKEIQRMIVSTRRALVALATQLSVARHPLPGIRSAIPT